MEEKRKGEREREKEGEEERVGNRGERERDLVADLGRGPRFSKAPPCSLFSVTLFDSHLGMSLPDFKISYFQNISYSGKK